MYLNLGCGRKIRTDCLNVDAVWQEGVDVVTDLSSCEWSWSDESVDGIHASHIIEHFPDQQKFIKECLRILKKGGFLRLCLPHSSSVTSIGCFGHYRTFSYSTMKQFLSEDNYMFGVSKFKTVEQKLNWWYECPDTQGLLPKWIVAVIKVVDPVMNWIIKIITPRIFENVICPTVQCQEVIYKGIKL